MLSYLAFVQVSLELLAYLAGLAGIKSHDDVQVIMVWATVLFLQRLSSFLLNFCFSFNRCEVMHGGLSSAKDSVRALFFSVKSLPLTSGGHPPPFREFILRDSPT